MVRGRGIPQAVPHHRQRIFHQRLPRAGEVGAGRRGAGHAARRGLRVVSLRHVVEHRDGGRLHRSGRGPEPHRRGVRHLQGLLHARRQRSVPHGALRRDGRAAVPARPRVRRRHGTQAPLRVAGPGGAQVRHHGRWRDAAHHDEVGRDERLRDDPRGHGL